MTLSDQVYHLEAEDPTLARQWYDALIQISKVEDASLGQMRTHRKSSTQVVLIVRRTFFRS